MITLVRAKRVLDMDDYKRHFVVKGGKTERGFRSASLDDVSLLVTDNTIVVDADSGNVVIAYVRVEEDLSDVVPYLNRIAFHTGYRADGSPTVGSRVVGTVVRNYSRKIDACTLSALHRDDPTAHDVILGACERAAHYYADLNPDLYEAHVGMTDRVLGEYRIGGTPFTSGIVNKNNVLPYHFDSGNFAGVWSMMLGWRRDVEGGHLVIPEYDLALEVADSTLSAFDGQVALHGVSPFRKVHRDAYRYTIVYYAKAGAWKCLVRDEELVEARRVRTLKERRRAGLVE